VNLNGKSAFCVIGMGFYEPWISIATHGQNETWLSVPRPANIEIKHFHSKPLGKFGQYLDFKHETLRWHSKLLSRILLVLDRCALFPLRSFIPQVSTSRRLKLLDEVLEVKFPDSYLTFKWKEIAFFQYFLNESKAKYLVYTTNSSYLNLKSLNDLIHSLPETNLYYGPRPYETAEFVSGSFRIYSRDVVEMIVMNRKHFDPARLEDVAIGQLLKRLGVNPTFTEIVNLSSIQEVESLSIDLIRHNTHYRLKSGTSTKRNDIEVMKSLHSRILTVANFS